MEQNSPILRQVALFACCMLISWIGLMGQNNTAPGHFSGDLQLNGRVFATDSTIGASGTPFYDWAKSSTTSWFSLNYSKGDFDIGMRFDSFNNADTFSGGVTEANGNGIGMWYIRKKIDKLTVQAGYIYDQFGSGTTFRSYEARFLGIDNALVGMMAEYEFNHHLSIKGIAGKQKDIKSFINKNRSFINTYSPYIKGLNLDGYWSFGKVSLVPGASVVNRTIDRESMEAVASEINGQAVDTRFVPKYNNFAWSVYNTVNFGDFSIYTEYAAKTTDVLRGINNELVEADGELYFGSLSYSVKGFGLSLQAKKMENFDFRTSPLQQLTDGIINFLPPQTRQNSLRLLSRYNHATQALDELSLMADVIYSPKKGLVFNLNVTDVSNDEENLFREYYFDVEIKKPKVKWKALVGLQMVDYNQAVLELKALEGDDRFVRTFTPFAEFTYKITRKKSLRVELQYLLTERNRVLFGSDKPEHRQDLGDWAYALIEYNVAPHYSISFSDMYGLDLEQHFYDLSASYTKGANRFDLGYVKQVEGIICTGGICRPENAFSGVKFGITSSF